MFLGEPLSIFVDSCRESSESDVIFFPIKVQSNNFGNLIYYATQCVPDCEDLPIFGIKYLEALRHWSLVRKEFSAHQILLSLDL